MRQTTDTVLMIRPESFRMNEETAVNNYFQEGINKENEEINKKAQEEFDNFVVKLREVGIKVIVVEDVKENNTPDALFPNNWITTHENATVAVYPMFAENRRRERREDILDRLEEEGFFIEDVVDYTSAEAVEIYLEGTGSMILDRQNRKAYCAISPRSEEDLFIEFCEDFEFTPVMFKAYQKVKESEELIYHTIVMMNVGEKFAVICLDTILDSKERKNVVEHLKSDGKEIITISMEQMYQFAGNMLELEGNGGKKYLVMSETAYKSLTEEQKVSIEKYSQILYAPLNVIETCGGGSARCMMAEVFLPKK